VKQEEVSEPLTHIACGSLLFANSSETGLPPRLPTTTLEDKREVLVPQSQSHGDVLSTPERPPAEDIFFATVAGFSKCGTSSFQAWFREHPELKCAIREEQRFLEGSYEEGVEGVYQMYEKHGNHIDVPKVVTKHPEAIYSVHDMTLLRTHFYKTKVMVGVRHPLLWWLSFYNFRTVDKLQTHLPHPRKLLGECNEKFPIECTDHGRFHYYIAQAFSKTPMTSPRERMLLFGSDTTHPTNFNISETPIPNQIFFYETQQLADPNEQRASKFRRDLADFLELNETFPVPPRVKPEEAFLPKKRLEGRARWKIRDFCSPEYDSIRNVLLQHSRDVADWIQEFFLHADIVVSSPQYLHSLFDYYRTDPLNCANKTIIDTTPWGTELVEKVTSEAR
jgi:hypothetical protein